MEVSKFGMEDSYFHCDRFLSVIITSISMNVDDSRSGLLR